MDDFGLIASDQMAQLRAALSSSNVVGINAALSEMRETLDSENFSSKIDATSSRGSRDELISSCPLLSREPISFASSDRSESDC